MVASISVPRRRISPLRVQLPVDLGQQPLGQAALGQLLPEAPDRAVVGHALGQRDAGEAAEREPVVDRRLQPLVGQPVPLLQEQQLDVGQQRVGQPALPAGVDAGDDRLQGRPVERRVQAVEPLALLAPPPHDAVRQAELPEVTPRHRPTPAPFPALNQKLAGRAKVSSNLPTIVTAAGDGAGRRFLEFFAAAIRNPHTRRAYGRSVAEFLAWCERAGVPSLS